MKFNEVAQAFARIEQTQSRLEITEELAKLFKKASPQEVQELCYLSLGILNPPYIGTQFAIAQKTMTKIVAQVLSISESTVTHEMHKRGDLGSVLEQYEWKGQEELTVHQLYEKLVILEQISGTGSQEKKSSHLQELLLMVDPVSAKYIVRIVLGTLRLGFSDMTLVDALSWMEAGDKSLRKLVEHAYNICADIGVIAATLKHSGSEALKEMAIHVGIPIRPAAAERLPDAAAIIEKLGPCVAEPKLDGFRLQVHIDATKKTPLIRFFSRNLLDMSYMFPELVRACAKLPVKTVILDGEAIVYDVNTGAFLPFQETVKRRRKHGIEDLVLEVPAQTSLFDQAIPQQVGAEKKLPLQLNVFDCMYLDGKSLLHSSQKERRHILEQLFKKEKSETILLLDEITVTTAEQLEQYFLKELEAGLEGVVVKKPSALYQAGKRSFNWVKLKYHAEKQLEDTIDVVILGYYAGRGKRAQFGIGAFLVGIYDKQRDVFETVAKVGTGLTDAQWHELKKKCDAIAVAQQPHNIICASELTPTVWLHPELVCEVLADEITISPVHSAGKTKKNLGLALRFPRFIKYRPDKSAAETTSLHELKSLQTGSTKS